MPTNAEAILAAHLTVSSRIRALSDAGYARADIARLVDRSYQQVRQVLVDEERRRARTTDQERAQTGMREEPARYLAEPLKLGATERVLLDDAGRLVLTPALIQALNARPGEYVIAVAGADGTIALTSARTAMEQAQALIRAHIPEGVSVVDEFIAERRAEAERENQR